jgi:hypothetical protein
MLVNPVTIREADGYILYRRRKDATDYGQNFNHRSFILVTNCILLSGFVC